MAWEKFASSEPAPYKSVCELLLDEILTNGFVTKNDPLQLSGKSADESHGEFFSLCYVKAASRSATLLALLDQVRLSFGLKIWDLYPGLADSVVRIHAAKVLGDNDPVSIALKNASLSLRGSIRRSHDTITWLGTLSLLKQPLPTCDAPTVINTWNKRATKAGQLVGQKRQSLIALLDLIPLLQIS